MAVRRAPLGKGTVLAVLALILGIVDVALNAVERLVLHLNQAFVSAIYKSWRTGRMWVLYTLVR